MTVGCVSVALGGGNAKQWPRRVQIFAVAAALDVLDALGHRPQLWFVQQPRRPGGPLGFTPCLRQHRSQLYNDQNHNNLLELL